jgi:hypothetical protein
VDGVRADVDGGYTHNSAISSRPTARRSGLPAASAPRAAT